MKHGKKYRAIAEKIDASKEYEVTEAIALLQETASANFDQALEIHIKLNIEPKKNDQQVRATVVLPHGTGRTKKVAVVTADKAKEAEAKAAGATLVGGEELIAEIKSGKIVPGSAFDILLATPDMMPKLASVAKILGPKGLMPSPKNETVTSKMEEAVSMLAKGKKASFKNDDGGNVHQAVGKLSFETAALIENAGVFLDRVAKSKPEGVKGKFIKSVVFSTTMGPGVHVKI